VRLPEERRDDWLAFPEDGRLYEIVDGELFVSPTPNIAHQRLSRDLAFALHEYLRGTGTGEVLNSPVGVKLGPTTVLEPDIVVVLRAHADRIGAQVIDGPPDLVVEILSPGTARRDLGVKRATYERAGVSEYWIVDPKRQAVEVLVLDRGTYASGGHFGRSDVSSSRLLPGVRIALADVFAAAG
jgi:Uma2 family endonuclease